MKFITTVAMPCTKEQFNKDLRNQLIKLGWKDNTCNWEKFQLLYLSSSQRVFNYDESNDFIGPNNADVRLTEYNSNLFLALAAMTDNPKGIKGEWWKCINGHYDQFTTNKYYQQINHNINTLDAFLDDNEKENSFGYSTSKRFIKATAKEIQQHFSPTKQTTMSKEIIGYKLKKEFHHMQKACEAITGYSFDFKKGMNSGGDYHVRNISHPTDCYNLLTKANVLELWFEPVMKEEEIWKDGDYLFVKETNKVLHFKSKESYSGYSKINYYSYDGNKNDYIANKRYEDSMRIATKQEIEAYLKTKETILTLGSSNIQVKITNGKITADGKEFSLKSLKDTVGFMGTYKTIAYPGYNVGFNGTFSIGYATFTKDELQQIINTVEKQLS